MSDDVKLDNTDNIYTSIDKWQKDEYAFRHFSTFILFTRDELEILCGQIMDVLDEEEHVCEECSKSAN